MNVQPNNDYHQIRLFNTHLLVKGMCDQYCPSFSVTDGQTDRQRFAFINIDVYVNSHIQYVYVFDRIDQLISGR